MSAGNSNLSKRRQKNVQHKVEWEANASNPVGITCPLTKCRDLFSLATNSVDIFNDVLGNVESLSKLQTNFQKLALRLLDASMCAWLVVLLYTGPHDTTAQLLEELIAAFSSGRTLPKGFSIRSPRGKAFLPPEEHALVEKACRESTRLYLFLSGQIINKPLEPRDPGWLLGLKLLHDADINQSALACNSLIYEIEINPKRMLLFQELTSFINAFRVRVLSFEKCYLELKTKKELLETTNVTLQRCRRKFITLLVEIAAVDNEELLDVPLDHYLKEHDDLRIAYHARQKTQKLKDRTHLDFNTLKGVFDVLFSCIRNMGILVARGVAMYTGLNLDTTSLLRVEPDCVVPSTVEASAQLYPIIYGGNSTSTDKNKAQREAVVSLLIHEIPWKSLASLAHLERVVSGTVSLRLVVATAAKLSDTLQSRLGSWACRALQDLVQLPRWYPVAEADTVPAATKDEAALLNPNMALGLLSVLDDDTEAPPKWRYFKRELSFDTRISTALVYWCSRGNKAMARRTLRWEEVVNDEPQSDQLLWKMLIERSVDKSEIIENVEKYYEVTEPTRTMQEMSKLTMAKAMDELDADGDSDDDSDSGSGSGSDEDEEDKDEDASSTGDSDGLEGKEDTEVLLFVDMEAEEEAEGRTGLAVSHSETMTALFDDEYALAILHCSATEIQNFDLPDFDLYKDAKELSKGSLECARYLHNELYSHMRKLLVATLEGPADDASQRFNHPLHLVSLLVQHDDRDNTTAPALCHLDTAHINTLVQQCTSIRRGVCDLVQQRVAMELLISALGGAKPTFIYPVFAPDHQHTVANRNAFRRKRGKSSRELYPELHVYHELLHKTSLNECLSELVLRLYESHRGDFTPMGPSGRCHIALILRLLTVIADIDCNIVIKHLRAACKTREDRGDKFWASNVALSKDLLWLAPFVISFEQGTFQIIGMHKKTAMWREKVINEEVYGNSVYRCDMDIVRNYSSLLSVLCSSSPTLCLKIGENSNSVSVAMLGALAIKDRIVAQFIFRAATAIVHHAKVTPSGVEKHNKAISKLVPFDAPATSFRTLFIQEGNALDIGCELLLGTYYDVWHMDSPPEEHQEQREEVVVPGTVVPMKKKVSKVRDMIQNSRESSGELQEESSYDDRLYPLLNEFNSSYHVETIAEESSQIDLENSIGEMSAEEGKAEEKAQDLPKNGTTEKEEVRKGQEDDTVAPEDSPEDNSLSHREDRADVKVQENHSEEQLHEDNELAEKRESKSGGDEKEKDEALPLPPHTSSSTWEHSHSHSQSQSQSNNFGSGSGDVFTSAILTEPSTAVSTEEEREHEQSPRSESQDNDKDMDTSTVDDVSTLGLHVINEWELILKEDQSLGAKSFALYTLECIIELVESRLELQDRIYHKSPGVFKCLYNLLTPKLREDFDLTASSLVKGEVDSRPDDGTQTLSAVHAHMGLIGATAEAIRIVVRRHPQIRELVRESGCVEGLMDALDMSYSIDDKCMGIFVVTAVEQLIVRNIAAWNFVKRAAGMKGLLQLCHMGNNAVRILATTEIISQITPKHDPLIYSLTEAVLNNSGLRTILRMLKSSDHLVQSASLNLLEALCVNKLACRHAVMMPEFIGELGTLLFSSSLAVVRVACDVLCVLGAEDQFTLQTLVRNMDSSMVRSEDNPSYSRKHGKKHSSITGRLMDIANGMVSTSSCEGDVAFTAKKLPSGTSAALGTGVSPTLVYPDVDEDAGDVQQPQENKRQHQYVTERLPPLFSGEPRLKQELGMLANKAAGVLAALTDTEESNWPDGGAPLRHTLSVSGLLPTIAGHVAAT